MTGPAAALDLSAGLLLEDENALLAWFTPRDRLLRIAAPRSVLIAPDRLSIGWPERAALGGLALDIQTEVAPAGEERLVPYAPWEHRDRLVHLRGSLARRLPDANDEFAQVKAHLVERLGRAIERQVNGYPQVEWRIGGTLLSWRMAERHVTYCELFMLPQAIWDERRS